MGKIVAFENVTLDGVMQAPARADEDTRGGFAYGGWANAHSDEETAAKGQEGMGSTGALLFGRRTYEDFFQVWPNARDNPFTDVLNRTKKYVVAGASTEMPWQNSVRIGIGQVQQIKDEEPKDIVILGSGRLVRSIMPLIDVFVLLIHPVTLGAGQKLFDAYAHLELIDSAASKSGVIVATYGTRR